MLQCRQRRGADDRRHHLSCADLWEHQALDSGQSEFKCCNALSVAEWGLGMNLEWKQDDQTDNPNRAEQRHKHAKDIVLNEALHRGFSSSSAILKQRSKAILDASSLANTSDPGRGFQHIDAWPIASNTAWYISDDIRKQIGRSFNGRANASSFDMIVAAEKPDPSGSTVVIGFSMHSKQTNGNGNRRG